MKDMKIVNVIGARPNMMKIAPVIAAMKRYKKFNFLIIHTGQHYDMNMSDIFLKELEIPQPKYNLGVGSESQAVQTAGMLIGIEKILLKEKPQHVLTYGDTNSALAGALAASKLNIPIAHIEAGLRSFNMQMPEEINRIITDSVSSLFFCPTKTAVENLKKEGKIDDVYLVGDVMYDSIKRYLRKIHNENRLNRYVLSTIHRAENTDCADKLKSIFKALGLIKDKVIIPLHPRTAKFIQIYRIKIAPNIKIIKPVSYIEMLNLEKYAKIIITDSGGVQKEAFIFNIPCITLRNETEWIETLENGMNIIAGTSVDKILEAVKKMTKIKKRIKPDRFYGDGSAHKRIVEILAKRLRD